MSRTPLFPGPGYTVGLAANAWADIADLKIATKRDLKCQSCMSELQHVKGVELPNNLHRFVCSWCGWRFNVRLDVPHKPSKDYSNYGMY